MATLKTYGFNALIGSTPGSMAAVDGDDLNDGDRALVFYSDNFYAYSVDASSGATELVPDIIAPSTNPGAKRWIQQGVLGIGDLALGETSTTAYRGDRGKTGYDHSQVATGNPHAVTQTNIGLSNVDNTTDADKPVSTATQTALDLKLNLTSISASEATDLTDGDVTTLHKHDLVGGDLDMNNKNLIGFPTLYKTVSNDITILDDSVAFGASGMKLENDVRITIGENSCLRFI